MTGARGHVLVVDDNLALAENLAEILDGAGYQAEVATSAEAALERLAAGDLLGVITDFRLPGRSGTELIGELRRRGVAIPVAVISAYTDGDVAAQAGDAGAFDVLPKPVVVERLLAVVTAFERAGSDVLVVEDNASFAEDLADALRGRGLEAVVEGTAAQALACRPRPGIAIIDLRLPDADGLLVARRLSARHPGLKILFMTAFGAEASACVDAELPGARTLDKPFAIEALLGWVDASLGR